ncbi:MAG TPA: membrane protein insertion efficiency factor YidD [Spirochaetota bacterium]|nr:membrane protein insertion efficiency factor YidD [Spirochaetota bacterium]HQO00648.1 membrane protein insertion efficiency factor YidD [Spirochaetota bacterium]HQP48930.1 membrane protein insertion efficiency factor YidD [Spirochaetota bacterium]
MRKGLSVVLLAVVAVYKVLLSPVLPPACRFYPTCSDYAVGAIKKHGPFRGLYMAVKRILRCNPFCEGGYDPVP